MRRKFKHRNPDTRGRMHGNERGRVWGAVAASQRMPKIARNSQNLHEKQGKDPPSELSRGNQSC